jgi:hypothetical protein
MSKRLNIPPMTFRIALLVLALATLGGAAGVCARALAIRATARRALELAATLDRSTEDASSPAAGVEDAASRGRGSRVTRGPNRSARPEDLSTTATTPTLAADAGTSATTMTAPLVATRRTTASVVAAGPTSATLTTRTEVRASSPTTSDGDASATREAMMRGPGRSGIAPRPPGAPSRTGGSRSGRPGGSEVPFPEKLTALLKTKKLFGAPPQPGISVQGVLGNAAFINNQWVEVGSSNGPVKLLEVHPDKVVVEVDGQRREMPIWQALPGSQSGASTPPGARPPTRGVPRPPPSTAPGQSAPAGRGGRIIVRYQGKEAIIEGNKVTADGQTMEMPAEQIAEMLKQIPSDAVVIRE